MNAECWVFLFLLGAAAAATVWGREVGAWAFTAPVSRRRDLDLQAAEQAELEVRLRTQRLLVLVAGIAATLLAMYFLTRRAK